MKAYIFLYAVILLACESGITITYEEIPRSRVIVLTDMLNEADDSQTMVRLLVHANEMDLEGLIAVSSCHQYQGKNDPIPARNTVHPDEIHKFVNTYSKILSKLKKHAGNWPSATYLHSIVAAGPAGYGMSAVGAGHATSGSKLIENALLRDDERPVYFCINAGANTLAQALVDLSARMDSAQLAPYLEKIRIYDDAGQDDAGAWIAHNFPQIRYQRSQSQVFAFMNDDGPIVWDSSYYPGKGQHMWAAEHIQKNHGPLGELYPVREKWKKPGIYNNLEGGGTSTWIGHVNHGLYHPEMMEWGGWGGRFYDQKVENISALQLRYADLTHTEDPFKPFYMYPQASDSWTDPSTSALYAGVGTPIYRWRIAYQNEFQARMDWCVKPFEKANHHPVAAFRKDTSDAFIHLGITSGVALALDASASVDPDGDDLNFHWFVYPEAGTFEGDLAIENNTSPQATLQVPKEASGHSIHVILELNDQNPTVSLYDYRRIILNVR